MSQTYIGLIISLASVFLPKLGLTIGSDDLTTTITTITVIVGAIWAAYGRYRLGGINMAGLRKI